MAKVQLSERKVERVTFHVGVQFGGVVKTGLPANDIKCDMKLCPMGVLVKTGGGEFIVTHANIVSIKLAPETEGE